jgi:predicted nucleic acid-binding protein
MDEALVDTDVLSELLKGKNDKVLDHATQYLAQHGQLAITLYEVTRGFRAAQASRQLDNFLKLASNSDVLRVSTAVLDRAATLWAGAYAAGHSRNDADLIIAATALESGRILVTGNASHFNWIAGLRVEDWKQP